MGPRCVNFQDAARWYSIAAQIGDPAGQANLGGLYFYGKGVRRDCAQAAPLAFDVVFTPKIMPSSQNRNARGAH